MVYGRLYAYSLLYFLAYGLTKFQGHCRSSACHFACRTWAKSSQAKAPLQGVMYGLSEKGQSSKGAGSRHKQYHIPWAKRMRGRRAPVSINDSTACHKHKGCGVEGRQLASQTKSKIVSTALILHHRVLHSKRSNDKPALFLRNAIIRRLFTWIPRRHQMWHIMFPPFQSEQMVSRACAIHHMQVDFKTPVPCHASDTSSEMQATVTMHDLRSDF